ncbi:hypothetical protein [Xanthomonas fragariae]|uniref:hypothetical protein n=1 Tax=Xanthomonas fragariae TaxID=48664 RepID=UPI0022AA3EC2|nr:hypothetical protein [Xanthomonas fragariae]WAT14948.1 hypothetical protein OZ429_18975 [Xanthomonas fragariae]
MQRRAPCLSVRWRLPAALSGVPTSNADPVGYGGNASAPKTTRPRRLPAADRRPESVEAPTS